MKKIIILLICIFSIGAGYVTPEPPKIADKSTYEYVRTLRNHLNRPDVTTTNPSGVRLGDYGDMLIYKNGTTFNLMINVSSPNGKTWLGVNLGII